MNTYLEREEEQLDRDLENRIISQFEYNKYMRELIRDYQSAAREAAESAYDREMANW